MDILAQSISRCVTDKTTASEWLKVENKISVAQAVLHVRKKEVLLNI